MKKQAVHNAVTTRFRSEYGETNFCLGILGHTHTGSEMSCGPGTRYEVFNTLAPADAWHASQLYGGDRIMHSLILHREGGIIARNQHDPVLYGRMKQAA